MRRIATTLGLLASVFLIGSAHAGSNTPIGHELVKMARATVVVPAEWDGAYTTLDTSYTCAGAFQNTSTGTDTICAGKDYSPNSSGSPIVFDCTGNATATTFDMTCTGSYDPLANCTANFTMVSHGMISGGDYFTVSTVNVTYTGSNPLCALLTPSCNQYNSHGTRVGPAPSEYCVTPTRRTTWGQVKQFYR